MIINETTCLMNNSPSSNENTTFAVDSASPPENNQGETSFTNEANFPASFLTTLIMSVLLGLVSGTLYGFGRYARALKQVLDISQVQVASFGIWLDCGNYIGHPLSGLIYDRHGARVACLLAALIVFSSYSTIHFMVQWKQNQYDDDVISNVSIVILKFAFAGVGFGSGLGYIAGLGSTTAHFLSYPKYMGRAVGLVAGGYGTAATLVGLTFRWFGLRHGSHSYFFLFWAIVVAGINLVAVFIFRPTPVQQEEEEVTTADSDSLFHEGLLEEDIQLTQSTSDTANEDSESHGSLSVDMVTQLSQDPLDIESEAWETWKDVDYWILFFSFACVTGCGLFVINNISTMAQSIGAKDGFAGTLIITLSASNVLGRIIMGALGDKTSGLYSDYKLFLFQIASVIMSVALFFLGMISPFPGGEAVSLVVMVIIVIMTYGGSWVVVVSILVDLFGKGNFGKDYGLMAMGPALSGLIFNSVSAWLYEEHTTDEDNNVCVGTQCYQAAYGITGTAALVGCGFMQVLVAKRRRALILIANSPSELDGVLPSFT